METDYLTNKAKNAPGTTGVYLMKDKTGRIIYVGKARNLRSRVRSYFGKTDSRPMISFLVSKIHDLDFIVTDTEKEALILENNLIKEHKPTTVQTIRRRLKHVMNPVVGLDLVRTKMVRDISIENGVVRVVVNLSADHQFANNIREEIIEKIEPLWDVKQVIVEFSE